MGCIGAGPLAEAAGDAEVDDLEAAIAHDDVARLQVAVDEGRGERLVQLDSPVAQSRKHRAGERRRGILLVDQVAQCAAAHKFHDHHQVAVALVHVVNAGQVAEPPAMLRQILR